MQQVHEALLGAAGKRDLVLLDTPELNAETPPHLLDDDITPLPFLFARNTGQMPVFTSAALDSWTLTIDGCVRTPRSWTIVALKERFTPVSQIAVMECAGNGRAFFREPTIAALWHHGAVGCVRWTGVRLAELLRQCDPLPNATYTGHYSPDVKLDASGPALSRGVPIEKAFAPETLIAYAINGEPIPPLHGGPLRIVVPGYPGSAWQKWLTRIAIRDREHDGERMLDFHYRLPRTPVRPGEPLDHAQFDVITDMPVRSLITFPREGFRARMGHPLAVRGHAWSGHVAVDRVELSIDGGRSWKAAKLGPLPDRFAWRRFEATFDAPHPGAIEIIARATDAEGHPQPLDSVHWNPRGYCNNCVHRLNGTVVP
jgi:DMSO/TMAO reductase YedYZ molybdopterin-dependent catalytic subunit